jgi:trimethylamine:corrinoid methyltransferase-like protein
MGGGSTDILARARQRVEELLASYERHPLAEEREKEMIAFAQREGTKAGLEGLPEILRPQYAYESGLI